MFSRDDTTPEHQLVNAILDGWPDGHMQPELAHGSSYEFTDLFTLEDYEDEPETVAYYSRMSASGYSDCTDWSWHEDIHGLIDWLLDEAAQLSNCPLAQDVAGVQDFFNFADASPIEHDGVFISKTKNNCKEHWVVKVETMDEGSTCVGVRSGWVDPSDCTQGALDSCGSGKLAEATDIDKVLAYVSYNGLDDPCTFIYPVEWLNYQDHAAVTLARLDQVNQGPYTDSCRFGNEREVIEALERELTCQVLESEA